MELVWSLMVCWEVLCKKDVVFQQEFDECCSVFVQVSFNLVVVDVNVERLCQVEGFKCIVVLFLGIIMCCNVDVGDLIDLGVGCVLFVLLQIDLLWVYVNVLQVYVNLVKFGQQVMVIQFELCGCKFEGKVVCMVGFIDVVMCLMQIEVMFFNVDNVLLFGVFVQVELLLKFSGMLLVVVDMFMFWCDGLLVVVVDEQNKVCLKKVRLGCNFGLMVEVLEGLKGDEKLIFNFFDLLVEGDQVEFILKQYKDKVVDKKVVL